MVAFGSQVRLLSHKRDGVNHVLELVHSDGVQLSSELTTPIAGALSLAPVLLDNANGPLDVALVNTHAELSVVRIENGKVSAPRTLATGIDMRFAPALARQSSGLLVAYTQTVEGAMHTFVAHVTDSKIAVKDVTPISHGAGAASFVLGADAATLVMLDARAGVSPLLEVGFENNGTPKLALVRTPVSQPYAPPLLVAVHVPNNEVQVAYTAIGRAAATAVGILPLRRAEAPRALLPSLGYGALSFSGALGKRAAVFALESPVSATKDAERALVVKVLDDRGEGPALTLKATHGTLSKPSIVAASDRAFFLLYFDGTIWMLAALDCDA